MFFTYVILNKERNKFYVGQTENLETRLLGHNKRMPNKKTSFTSLNNGTWKLIYKEEFNSRSEAIKREKELKSSRGRFFIKQALKKW
ncbi:MAG: GIY-YIG nuclease family protein [Candidatus Pacebacteria bacterium]|nr:GIY-YIG nuclease family protein [Candidatus Paceibacterota bacterium]